MKLKLTLSSAGDTEDVAVTADATATVGQLAERLRAGDPRHRSPASPGESLTLRVSPPSGTERVLPWHATLADAGLRSGDRITLTNDSPLGDASAPPAATLRVVSGPDTGKTFSLPFGTSMLGRDRSCDVRLVDATVSKRHARINVTDTVEVYDDHSANGVLVGGEPISRVVVGPTEVIEVGNSAFTITLHLGAGAAMTVGHTIGFNRSPVLDPRFEGVEFSAPEPPARQQRQRFPIISVVAPILMAVLLYAITKSALSFLFVALSPILAVGAFFEGRWASKTAFAESTADFRASLQALSDRLQHAAELERASRQREHPSVSDVATAIDQLAPLCWTRRPGDRSFLELRLGLGVLPSRSSVKLSDARTAPPELVQELLEVAGRFASVDRVPVVAALRECGALGVAGSTEGAQPLADALVLQLVGLHAPSEVVVACLTTPKGSVRWNWLKWLPHTSSDHSPLPCEHLAASSTAAGALVAALEDLVERRSAVLDRDAAPALPRIVVLVDEAAVDERARWVHLVEEGPAAGVHLVWLAPSLERIPAGCRTYLELDPNSGEGRAGFVDGGVLVAPLELEPIPADRARAIARRLAPVIDAGARLDDQSDLPHAIPFLSLAAVELTDGVDDVVERWRGSNSLAAEPGSPRLAKDNHLRALVGQATVGRQFLDLRTDGPHALVGGTTGAGKSEFLQSWVLGMALAHSPTRVNFLLVDYKGGAAFADCVHLPHSVGLVTDLNPHLVRRVLRSLNAELRRREHVLGQQKAKDLLELERRRDPEAPPSLVIVVDEFAALVAEVPEFVEGVVNVAQRGRSLGLHLILATQRPAGVIKDSLRSNTNLRVALRVADEVDSDDVVGTPVAATFDPAIPGRAVVKTGPGRLSLFQSAYAGGHTSDTPPPPVIEISELPFGVAAAWEVEDPATATADGPSSTGPTDLHRLVSTIAAASDRVALPTPRKPWLPELAAHYRLEDLPTRRTDDELVFGVVDRPDDQEQAALAFVPDRDGNMGVYGTGGAGKSTFLRSLAVAAGFAPARGGPCHVYALDFGARGLRMLDGLPHVGAVIGADDTERTTRLLAELRSTIDERAERFAEADAATIGEYRARSGESSEPRILLLVDNFGAFRSTYELGLMSRWFEVFESIAADGRGVGVHVVVTVDRPGAVTASLNSVIQKHVVLRLTSDADLSLLGVPQDVFSEATPPGRGFVDGLEVQAAVLGGQASVAKQAAAITKLAAAMERAGVLPAPPIARLPERVALSELAVREDGLLVFGIGDETLGPVSFDPVGVFLVAGPAESGRTTTVVTMLQALHQLRPAARFALFGSRRSPLGSVVPWAFEAKRPEEMEALAGDLAERIGAEEFGAGGLVVVLEDVPDLAGGPADEALQDLLRACRAYDHFVIAEGEASSLRGAWGLIQAAKSGRTGILLQPDDLDGDSIFNTPLPRINRAEFPQGRGFYVRGGRAQRVQVALPG